MNHPVERVLTAVSLVVFAGCSAAPTGTEGSAGALGVELGNAGGATVPGGGGGATSTGTAAGGAAPNTAGTTSGGGTVPGVGGTTGAGAGPGPGAGSSAGGTDPVGSTNAGTTSVSGASGVSGTTGAGGAPGAAGASPGVGGEGSAGQGGDRVEGVSDTFSFFVTSYFHIKELSGSDDGFGGNLGYGGKVGVEGADAICQEMANRVGFNNRTWRAYLSTSMVNAKDRVGPGPWYDFVGNLVANDVAGLLVEKAGGGGGMGGGMGGGGLNGGDCAGEEDDLDRPLGGALDCGTYDELGTLHNGSTDQNNDGTNDDDHDTMTATLADGTYAGFSCEDWTSTTAQIPDDGGEGGSAGSGGFGGFNMGGIQMGHSWPAGSGTHWAEAHAGHACAAGTNFVQDGAGDSSTVGGGGGYGGFYCLALAE